MKLGLKRLFIGRKFKVEKIQTVPEACRRLRTSSRKRSQRAATSHRKESGAGSFKFDTKALSLRTAPKHNDPDSKTVLCIPLPLGAFAFVRARAGVTKKPIKTKTCIVVSWFGPGIRPVHRTGGRVTTTGFPAAPVLFTHKSRIPSSIRISPGQPAKGVPNPETFRAIGVDCSPPKQAFDSNQKKYAAAKKTPGLKSTDQHSPARSSTSNSKPAAFRRESPFSINLSPSRALHR